MTRSSIAISQRPLFLKGIERLWLEQRILEINGTAKSPDFWFDGTGLDPVAKTWTDRVTGTVLALAGTGPEPNFSDTSPFSRKAIHFNAGQRLQGGTSLFDLTTVDFVYVIFFHADAVSGSFITKASGAVGTWCAYSGSNAFACTLNDGDAYRTIASAALTQSQGYLGHIFADRSGSGQAYIDGLASGSPLDITQAASDLTNGGNFVLGAYDTDATKLNGRVALIARWSGAAWLNSHLQPEIAARHCAIVKGS